MELFYIESFHFSVETFIEKGSASVGEESIILMSVCVSCSLEYSYAFIK